MRDAALSMRTLMITNNDTDVVNPLMQAYVQWVLNVQSKKDPNNIDVRGKFSHQSPTTNTTIITTKIAHFPLFHFSYFFSFFQLSPSSKFPLETLTLVDGADLKLMVPVFVVEPTLSMPSTC